MSGLPEPTGWGDTPPPEWTAATDALMAIGMVNRGPWWHWSFGDAQWCVSTGAPAPLYGPIA